MSDQSHTYTDQAITLMMAFIRVPNRVYVPAIYQYTEELPPEEVLEAVEIAQAKFPNGGLRAFNYFCGICRNKIKSQIIWKDWKSRQKSRIQSNFR